LGIALPATREAIFNLHNQQLVAWQLNTDISEQFDSFAPDFCHLVRAKVTRGGGGLAGWAHQHRG